MAPTPVRLRHPRGVTNIEVDPEVNDIGDLKVIIFSATEIPPSEQDIKLGYPPKPLPERSGPLGSLISRGEQLIVVAVPRKSPRAARRPSVKELDAVLSAPEPLPERASSGTRLAAQVGRTGTAEGTSVRTPAGVLELRVVPDDNSCLFSAVGVVFEGGIEAAQGLRKVIADAIRSDPEYSDALLGRPREEYIAKILEKDTWGGAIELAIFAKHYKTEISSFDVATGRCDRFGEGEHDSRCLLVYSGIHYDAMTLAPEPGAPAAFHTTVFPTSDNATLAAAQTLAARLKSNKYFTDTANFDLRCGVCGVGLKGEKGAREHAMATGHVEFGEY